MVEWNMVQGKGIKGMTEEDKAEEEGMCTRLDNGQWAHEWNTT